ncbi:MAG TPA: lytic transglycosylase domain-containing protein, partial [Longimicrobium sp.]
MLRTPPKALSLALLLGSTACAAAPRVPTAPAAPTARAQEPERIQETFVAPPVAATPVRRDLLGSARYDLPVEANRWVEMELDFLVKQRHDVIGRWLQRSEKYDDFVQEVFAAHGIPRDLHHLAMVESGYSPTARSHAGALGMWQFMPATGRSMGLRIDDVVDERMDPVRATYAAARHLRDLHRGFRGDWALAAAAYNAGATRINRGLGRYNASNFWELSERGDLAQETRHYVPRLFAVTIIGRDPARFGYPARSALVRRFHYDSVKVDIETPVAELAKIGKIPATELTELNPHLHRGIVPARYTVWTPGGSGTALQAAFDSSEYRRSGGYGWYTLRRGENAESVASAAGITADRIREMNLSVAVDRIGSGSRVRLPAPSVALLNSRPMVRADTIDELEAARRASRASRASRSAEARRQTEERRAAAREADRVEAAARAARRASADSASRAATAERRAARSAQAGEERPVRPAARV